MTTTAVLSKGLSDIGPVRDENQDSIRFHVPDDPEIAASHGSLFGIADGMGGYAKGGLASATAIETFFAAYYGDRPAAPTQTLRRAMEQANLAVHQAAFRINAGQMGTTLTTANIIGSRLYLAHVGDTRAYLVREGKARCLTNDHSVVGELVRMRVISPDKVRTHYQRSILNKSLGLNMFVRPDVSFTTLQQDDVILLCSDGLWAFVEDDEIARLATQIRDAGELCQNLIDAAIHHNTDDNASVVAVCVQQVAADQPTAQVVASGWRRVTAFLGQLF